VDMILSNAERPLAYTSANPAFKADGRDKDEHSGGSRGSSPEPDEKGPSEALDTSPASLIGLYIVSDILASSSTSGIRHAWRYRQLVETALRNRKLFETLGTMADRFRWGRLRAEKWKRSVSLVLGLWDGWCVFTADTHEFLANSFENPPGLKKEGKADEDASKKGRWKTVEATAAKAVEDSGFRAVSQDVVGDTAGAREATVDQRAAGEAAETKEDDSLPRMEYIHDEELDLAVLDEEDIDGEPLDMSRIHGVPLEEEEWEKIRAALGASASGDAKAEVKSVGGLKMSAATVAPRKRIRAVDMFADSDSEGEE